MLCCHDKSKRKAPINVCKTALHKWKEKDTKTITFHKGMSKQIEFYKKSVKGIEILQKKCKI